MNFPKTFPTLLFLLFFWTAYGQNLVPNPGFEAFSNCPTNSCQWDFVSNWHNVSGIPGCGSGISSPDFFHTCGTTFYTFPFTLNGEVTPLSGNAVMGIATWLTIVPNFREYLDVQLTAPLQVGTAYTLTFSYTNGDFDPTVNYGGFGTEIGAHLSVGGLAQTGTAPIVLTPTFETTGAIYSTTWQTISYSFTALAPFTHLTFGNFRTDAAASIQQFASPSNASFPYAYYYFDDIRLEEAAILPQDNLVFTANAIGSEVQLDWELDPLQANTQFRIQRSQNGREFNPWEQVEGQTGDSRFRILDKQPFSGISYYRLSSLDSDGTERLSLTRQVLISNSLRWSLSPNPARGSRLVQIQHNALESQYATLQLSDLQGRLLRAESVMVDRSLTWDLGSLAAAVYVLHIVTPSGSQQIKLLVD